MKKTVYIIALVTGIVCAAVSARAETKVFLLGGQSNMAGLGGYDFPLPTPYSVPQPNVQFWNYGPGTQPDPTYGINYPGVGTGWVDLQSGFGHKPEHFGPEVTFGYTLNNIFPDDDIYLIKEGISSQDLAVHWNPDGTGNIYNIFKSRVDAAMQNLTDAGLSPTIAGMIWMQGESDALNPAYAPHYETNLTNLIQTVRSDFNTPDMPFVMGRILTMWGTPADNALVRGAQETVSAADANVSWVDTDDLQLAYVGHYGTQGQIDLGIRYASEFGTPVLPYSFPEKDSAEFDYKYEMDVDPTDVNAINLDAGVGGNTTADWVNFASTPASVADGIMTMSNSTMLMSGNTAGELWPNVGFTGGEGFTLEISMKTVGGSATGTVSSAIICPSDNSEFGMLQITPSNHTWVGMGTQQNINSDDFHDYRVVRDADTDGGLWWLWRDGVLLTPNGTAKSGDLAGLDKIYFGPGISPSYDGSLEVDYVRLTEGAFAPPPGSVPTFDPPEIPKDSGDFGYRYEMDVNPTNPSEIDLDSDGKADWVTAAGAPLSVENGTMTIQSDGMIRSGLNGEGIWTSQGFTAADGFTFELSMQVIEQDAGFQYTNTIVLAPTDNDEAAVVFIGDDCVSLGSGVLLTGIDNTDGQHVFRITRDSDANGGRWWMWRDDELVSASGYVPAGSFPDLDSIYFGPAVSAASSGILAVDYIRLDNDGPFAPVTVIVPGDANGDGRVDDEDATALAENWQTQSGATWAMGDFNEDGKVDDIDATLLAANWQSGVGATVPEPGMLTLLAFVAAAFMASRRRK